MTRMGRDDDGKVDAAGARRTARRLLAVVGLLAAATLAAFLGARRCTPPPPPALVAARETTWFTSPLRDDGFVDYAAALAAQARADGAREEDDAGPLLEQALRDFAGPGSFAGTTASGVASAVATWRRGAFDEPGVAWIATWLERNEAVLARVAQAVQRPRCFLAPQPGGALVPSTSGGLGWIGVAFGARFARAAAHGATEAALADLDAALALAGCLGAPAGFAEQSLALAREAELLDAVAASVKGPAALPPARALERIEARRRACGGEAGLREGLFAVRLLLLDGLAEAWRGRAAVASAPQEGAAEGLPDGSRERTVAAMAAALRAADLNRLFRHVNARCDELEAALLGGGEPLALRIDPFLARIAQLRAAGRPLPPQRRGPLGLAIVPADELARHVADVLIGASAETLVRELDGWLALVAECERRIAELAARAGAPTRRDRLLRAPLDVRAHDGSFAVEGELLDLAATFAVRAR